METRRLGRSDLHISTLVLGGNVFGWTVHEMDADRLLDAYIGAGGNTIDTADVYSRWIPGHVGGESETIIGKWLTRNQKRHSVVIATKVGLEMGEGKKGLKPAYIRRAIEGSLKRLQTDYIDLYQSHVDDPETPLADVLGTYEQLIKEGKVRTIGASNYTADRLKEALRISKEHNLPRYESLQPLYNLMEREPYESTLEPIVLKEHIGVIPYFALAAGFLTGKYRSAKDLDGKARAATVGKYLNERGFAVLHALDEVSKNLDATPTQVALAWLIARPSVTAPIASATTIEQLRDLIAATDLKLDPASIEQLNSASERKMHA
jgi:aryl-alcohol dehydrogenase-like predicted oxidoreductase